MKKRFILFQMVAVLSAATALADGGQGSTGGSKPDRHNISTGNTNNILGGDGNHPKGGRSEMPGDGGGPKMTVRGADGNMSPMSGGNMAFGAAGN